MRFFGPATARPLPPRTRRKRSDPTAPAGDRLRAMEQLENRALGKPKETVEHQNEEPEATRILRDMSTEQLIELRRRGLRAVDAVPEH